MRLQQRGEVSSVADPGHLQLHRPYPRVPGALPVTVALSCASGTPLVTPCAYVLFYFHLHECLGGHQRAVLGQVALEGCRELSCPQPTLKLVSPPVEDLLGFIREPHGRDAFFILIGCAEVLWVQIIQPLEDLVGPVLRPRVGPAIYVSPSWGRVWPHYQLETL